MLIVGVLAHRSLLFLTEYDWLQSMVVFVVMWMMAIPVPFGLVRNAVLRPWPAILASLLNMALMPLIAFGLSKLLNAELGGGLIVAAALPSTLASSAVLTRKAGGDDTVAIFVTLITNVSCAFVTPLWMVTLMEPARVESTAAVPTIQLVQMIKTLTLLVLVPILVAQFLRRFPAISTAADRNRTLLSTLCQIGILLMVFFGAIQMGDRLWSSQASSLGMPQILSVALITTFAHLSMLATAWYLAQACGVSRPQRIAVAFSGSQKTLMVGLKLAMDFQVSILPIVIYHVGQLTVDSILADYWKKQTPASHDTSRSDAQHEDRS